MEDLKNLSEDGLRDRCSKAGLQTTGTRDDLEKRLTEHLQNSAAPATIKVPWLAVISLIAVTAAALGAIWQARETAVQARVATELLQTELRKTQEEIVEEKRLAWQSVNLYEVIETGSQYPNRGLAFDDIYTKFTRDGTGTTEVEIEKHQITKDELKRLLFALVRDGMVFRTTEGKYNTQVSAINWRSLRSLKENDATYGILNQVTTNGGEYTIAGLSAVIVEKYSVSIEEYNLILNRLFATDALMLDENMHLWTKASPPPQNDK